MTVYLIAIFFTMLLGYMGNQHRYEVVNTNGGLKHFSWGRLYTIMILMVWCFVFTYRNIYVGTDGPSYYRIYTGIRNVGYSFSQYISFRRDYLFSALEYLCSLVSGGNWFFYQFVVSLLIYLPVIHVAQKYSDDVQLSLLLFIFTFRFFNGYNGMRQEIAASLVALAYYDCLLERKYIKSIILLVIAVGFHSSTLIAIPFILLSTRDLHSTAVKWTGVGLIVFYLAIWQIWPLIIRFLSLIGQSKMALDYAEVSQDKGSGFVRFVVSILPFIMGYLSVERLRQEYDELVDHELVLCLFSGLFMLLSMRYWIFARVAEFFVIGQIMFVPKLKSVFRGQGKGVILVLYLAYMIALLLHGDGHYYPYSFFWN